MDSFGKNFTFNLFSTGMKSYDMRIFERCQNNDKRLISIMKYR